LVRDERDTEPVAGEGSGGFFERFGAFFFNAKA
jgi:hypothetical protein